MSMFFCKLAPLVALNAHDISIIFLAMEDIINNTLEALAIHHVDAGIPFVVIHIHIVQDSKYLIEIIPFYV